jgi:hypothetical protein
MTAPGNPPIYHIVHLNRLASIFSDGYLFSDELMSERGVESETTIGMRKLKDARKVRSVGSPDQGTVGQYVPFYFCPRAVMLYMISVRSVQLMYRGGQRPIIHLVSDFNSATDWAAEYGNTWSFTNANASSMYSEFFDSKDKLNELQWDLIPNRDWQQPDVKNAKQSEFLMRNKFPWHLISEIGVIDESVKSAVETLLVNVKHKPIVNVHKEWYYENE